MAYSTDDDDDCSRWLDGNADSPSVKSVSSNSKNEPYAGKSPSLDEYYVSLGSQSSSADGKESRSPGDTSTSPLNIATSSDKVRAMHETDCSSFEKTDLASLQNDVSGLHIVDPIEKQIEKKLEVGSILETLDQVYVLYCEYARCIGFNVKKGTQSFFKDKNCNGKVSEDESLIRMKVYHCSCEGFPDKKRSINHIPKYKKQVLRSDCKARLRVVSKRDGPWVVSVFRKDHNHELLNPEQSYLLRSARNLSHAKKSIVEALHGAGIGISRVCHFMEKESGGPQNVGFTRQDVYSHFSKMKKSARIENGDANALLKHFIEKSNKEQSFHWNVEVDDDGRLMNLFIRDGQSAIDYEFFGDVMTVDTTFRTNRYNLIYAPFVGINHQGNNVMFAIAFLSNETT